MDQCCCGPKQLLQCICMGNQWNLPLFKFSFLYRNSSLKIGLNRIYFFNKFFIFLLRADLQWFLLVNECILYFDKKIKLFNLSSWGIMSYGSTSRAHRKRQKSTATRKIWRKYVKKIASEVGYFIFILADKIFVRQNSGCDQWRIQCRGFAVFFWQMPTLMWGHTSGSILFSKACRGNLITIFTSFKFYWIWFLLSNLPFIFFTNSIMSMQNPFFLITVTLMLNLFVVMLSCMSHNWVLFPYCQKALIHQTKITTYPWFLSYWAHNLFFFSTNQSKIHTNYS